MSVFQPKYIIQLSYTNCLGTAENECKKSLQTSSGKTAQASEKYLSRYRKQQPELILWQYDPTAAAVVGLD